MIRTELVGLGLAVSLIVVVVAIATSDISSLSNPDYTEDNDNFKIFLFCENSL